jgi:hypothetical protein
MRSWAVIGASAVAMILCHAGAARAEISAKQLLAALDKADVGAEAAKFALEMTANGLTWANSDLVGREVAPLFCPPKDLAFRPPLLIDMLREAVARDARLNDTPFGMTLMMAFKMKYPCPSK